MTFRNYEVGFNDSDIDDAVLEEHHGALYPPGKIRMFLA